MFVSFSFFFLHLLLGNKEGIVSICVHTKNIFRERQIFHVKVMNECHSLPRTQIDNENENLNGISMS